LVSRYSISITPEDSALSFLMALPFDGAFKFFENGSISLNIVNDLIETKSPPDIFEVLYRYLTNQIIILSNELNPSGFHARRDRENAFVSRFVTLLQFPCVSHFDEGQNNALVNHLKPTLRKVFSCTIFFLLSIKIKGNACSLGLPFPAGALYERYCSKEDLY